MRSRLWLCLTFLVWVFPSASRSQELPTSADAVGPALIGASVPDAPLVTVDDQETTLHAALGDAAAVLVYYRGGW